MLRFSKTRILFYFHCLNFIHISANMSPFRLKFSQMILHTETSKLMYNWSFLFVVLHKPTLLPSTFNPFRMKTPKYLYSQEEMNLYCIIELATAISLFSLQISKLDVLGRQNKIWTFGNPFQSKQSSIFVYVANLRICRLFRLK